MVRPLRGFQEVQGLGGVKEVRRDGEDFLSRRRDAGSSVQGVSRFLSEQKPPSDLEGPVETKTRTPVLSGEHGSRFPVVLLPTEPLG